MTDPNFSPADDVVPLSEYERLLALYPLYVEYTEAMIKENIQTVPPKNPEDEQRVRELLAPATFEEFPRLLASLGEDRCHYERCWELGYEAARDFAQNDPSSGVRRMAQAIKDIFETIDRPNRFPQRKWSKRPEGNDGDGHLPGGYHR